MTAGAESFDPAVSGVLATVLPDAGLIGGDTSRRVTRVIRMRLGTGLGVIEGGELVVATQEALQRAGWPRPALEELARAGVAGLVVLARSVPALDAPPPIAVATVDREPAAARRVEEDLAAAVARLRRDLYAYAQRLQREVVDIAIAGGGLEDVVRALARASGRSVVMEAEERLLHRSPDAWLPAGTIPAFVHARQTGHPVRTVGTRGGWLTLYGPGASPDLDSLTLARGSTACAIVLGRAEPITPLHALLDPDADSEHLARELRRAGHELDRQQAAVAVRPADEALLSACHSRWRQHRQALREDTLLVLAAGVDGAALARDIMQVAGCRFQVSRSDHRDRIERAGVSHPVLGPQNSELRTQNLVRIGWSSGGRGVAGAARALAEAMSAVELAVALDLDLVAFADVVAEAALVHMPVHHARTYVERVLGPLTLPERERDRLTLAAYLTTNRNVAAAAAALGVHRNTVHHRLRAMQRDLGSSLDVASTLFELELALRLWRLHRGCSPPNRQRGDGPQP